MKDSSQADFGLHIYCVKSKAAPNNEYKIKIQIGFSSLKDTCFQNVNNMTVFTSWLNKFK